MSSGLDPVASLGLVLVGDWVVLVLEVPVFGLVEASALPRRLFSLPLLEEGRDEEVTEADVLFFESTFSYFFNHMGFEPS